MVDGATAAEKLKEKGDRSDTRFGSMGSLMASTIGWEDWEKNRFCSGEESRCVPP